MPTMLLGGLWHSPAWSFVLWGVAHGARLAAERGRRRRFGPPRPGAWRRGLAVGGTAPAVCLLWVLFRAPGMDGTVAMFSAPVGFEGPNRWINP
jgi:alginate O-acetyltransferase complex protein AlgI